jgi:hypothetical protein
VHFPLLLVLSLPGGVSDEKVITRVEPEDCTPDPRKVGSAITPDGKDLQRLDSLKGKSKAAVLRLLGHPARVEFWKDGREVWVYPWPAHADVRFRSNKVESTFYSSGY